MPGPLLKKCLHALFQALALAAAGLLAGGEAWAAGGTAQVSVEVPEGKTKTIRLRNLPSGTSVAVRIEADGTLVVALVSGVQLKSRKPEALFRASLDRRMSFKVITQESSHYYLVLDNRRGSEAVKARATIRVEGGASPPAKH
jgi:3-dehydroquinate synthase class II